MSKSEDDLLRRAQRVAAHSDYELMEELVACSEILQAIEPKHRKPWLAHVVEELYDQQNGKCAICQQPLALGQHHVDHKIPFCYGGGNERGNLQLAHPACNQSKGRGVSAKELLRYLEDRYMNLGGT